VPTKWASDHALSRGNQVRAFAMKSSEKLTEPKVRWLTPEELDRLRCSDRTGRRSKWQEELNESGALATKFKQMLRASRQRLSLLIALNSSPTSALSIGTSLERRRKRSLIDGYLDFGICFNGAAFSRTRKPGEASGIQVARSAASMGPRSLERGNRNSS
jgi:hypothetical protein